MAVSTFRGREWVIPQCMATFLRAHCSIDFSARVCHARGGGGRHDVFTVGDAVTGDQSFAVFGLRTLDLEGSILKASKNDVAQFPQCVSLRVQVSSL